MIHCIRNFDSREDLWFRRGVSIRGSNEHDNLMFGGGSMETGNAAARNGGYGILVWWVKMEKSIVAFTAVLCQRLPSASSEILFLSV